MTPPFSLVVDWTRQDSILLDAMRIECELADPSGAPQVIEMVDLMRRWLEPLTVDSNAPPTSTQSIASDLIVACDLLAPSTPVDVVVLVALLAQVHYAGASLRRVRISPANTGPLSIASSLSISELIQSAYATCRPHAAELSPEMLSNAPGMLELRSDFPFRRKHIERLEETLRIWAHFTCLGGFLWDFHPQENFSPHFGEFGQLSPTWCRLTWDAFEGDAMPAFAALLASLHRWRMPYAGKVAWQIRLDGVDLGLNGFL